MIRKFATLAHSHEASIRDSFARQTMMHTLGAELIAVQAGSCTLRALIAPHVRQQHGAAHAALAFARNVSFRVRREDRLLCGEES